MKFSFVGIALSFALLAGCSTSDGSSRSASFTEITDDEGNVTHQCTIERATGTRVGSRVCRTIEAIEEERRRSQEALNRTQSDVIYSEGN